MLNRGKFHGRWIIILIASLVVALPGLAVQSTGIGMPNTYLASSNASSCGSILFSDDFNDGNADGWTTSGAGSWFVENNYYVVDMGFGSGLMGKAVAGDAAWTDYIFELDLYAEMGVDKGFRFRYMDESNYYAMDIVGSDYNFVNLVKVENGVGGTLALISYESNSPEWHHAKVIVMGKRYTGFVGEDLVFDYTDTNSTITHGKIGLQGWTGAYAWDIVHFDNIVVRQPCMGFLPSVLR
jgi:hypothetical protein